MKKEEELENLKRSVKITKIQELEVFNKYFKRIRAITLTIDRNKSIP